MTDKRQPEPGQRPRFERPQSAGEASPQRPIRVPDSVWVPACEKANQEGRRISAVVRDLLRDYALKDSPAPPRRLCEPEETR